MSAQNILEKLASLTWHRIDLAKKYNIQFGEETITNLNLLDIYIYKCSEIYTIQTQKIEESKIGTDWEWWIGNNNKGVFRYAIQAKKIDQKHCYKLSYKIKNSGNLQIDLLEQYARANNAKPLYCLYNYLENLVVNNYWHCCQNQDEEQLGCTITPSQSVRHILNNPSQTQNFYDIHSIKETLPWRCLLCNQNGKTSSIDEPEGFYPLLPDELNNMNNVWDNFPSNIYNQELGHFPKRIVVINQESEFS